MGDPDFPDRSTTLIVQTSKLMDGPYAFVGPGIPVMRSFGFAGAPDDFEHRWRMNRRTFPLGLDLIFVTQSQIASLPRSLRILEA